MSKCTTEIDDVRTGDLLKNNKSGAVALIVEANKNFVTYRVIHGEKKYNETKAQIYIKKLVRLGAFTLQRGKK